MLIPCSPPIDSLVADPLEHTRVSRQKKPGAVAIAQTPEWRNKLEALEKFLQRLPPLETPVTHWFSRGVYAREMFLPSGTLITGRIHKYSQINVLMQGEVSVLMEGGVRRIRAPYIYESPEGTKRAVFVHEDARWLTICGTHTTDTDVLIDELTSGTYQEYEAFCASLTHEKGE